MLQGLEDTNIADLQREAFESGLWTAPQCITQTHLIMHITPYRAPPATPPRRASIRADLHTGSSLAPSAFGVPRRQKNNETVGR